MGSFVNNVGEHFAVLDKDGVPVMTIGNETAVSRMLQVLTWVSDRTYSWDTNFNGPNSQIFDDGRALFMLGGVHDVKVLRAMEIDFGVIPYPKYDTAQRDYIPAVLGLSISPVCVPKTNHDLESTGLFMEAFAYEGYKSVVPAFYESILLGKLTRDGESVEMLDYIFGNIEYDTGNIFNFGSIVLDYDNVWGNGGEPLVSFLEKRMPGIKADVDRILEAVNSLE
jgi:hypothetical protein